VTAAFQDFTGSGFTSDSEGANANLDINMSEDSARNLWDVQAAIQQIATDFQTAVRAASDFNSYLISIRETSQTVKVPEMGTTGGEGGNMSYSGGRVDTSSVPLIQSEAGMAGRVAEMEENSSGSGGGILAVGGRAQRPADVGGFVNQATQAAWLASSMGAGAQGTPQATGEAYQQAYQYAQSPGGRYDPDVTTAVFQGQTGTPHAYAASQLVSQGLPAAQRFLGGGGLGGFAAMAGRLGTYGAIGYAAYQLGSAGLETYAQSRAMAISANNSQYGAGWGFGQRIGQATMALSPFVSQEEASQIYSSAVSQGWASNREGYASGNFGQAVDFMYGATKDYNMDPAMGAQLLQTNALGAGQSINALNQQLFTLKETLDGTGVSMDVASSSFTSFTSQLISQGSDPGVAAQIAGGALSAYAGNGYLGATGRGAQIVMDTIGQEQTQNILSGLTGTVPGAAFSGEHGIASTKELQRLTSRFTTEVMSMKNLDMDERAAIFRDLYNSTFGTQITQQDSLNMIAENTADRNLLTEGQQKYLDKGRMGELKHQSSASAFFRRLDDLGNAGLNDLNDPAAQLAAAKKNSHLINGYQNYNEEVNKLLESAGSGGTLGDTVLYGPDGKPVTMNGNRVAGANIAKWFNESGNYDKFSARKSGYYIQDSAGVKHTSDNIGLGGADQTALAEDTPESRTVYIQLSAQAKQYFDTNKDKLTLDTGHS